MNIYKSSKDNKLRQFTFKVVHRIITTKKELLKYKLASDDKCPFCLNPDSIEHTFLYCQESKEFFSKTLQRLPLTRAFEGFLSVCLNLSFRGRQSTVSMVFHAL